jgi:mRNA-degrading endonuclease toxin of MazEF toxin-antitoxin module
VSERSERTGWLSSDNVVELRPRGDGFPRQGAVFELGAGRHVIVVSNDDYNEVGAPEVVRVLRQAPPSAYVVQLADADPVAGRAVVGPVFPVPRGDLGRPAGMVTGATWERLNVSLRLLLDL